MTEAQALQRAHELLERLRGRIESLEALAESGDVDTAVDELAGVAQLAKEIEVEINRARAEADAGS